MLMTVTMQNSERAEQILKELEETRRKMNDLCYEFRHCVEPVLELSENQPEKNPTDHEV